MTDYRNSSVLENSDGEEERDENKNTDSDDDCQIVSIEKGVGEMKLIQGNEVEQSSAYEGSSHGGVKSLPVTQTQVITVKNSAPTIQQSQISQVIDLDTLSEDLKRSMPTGSTATSSKPEPDRHQPAPKQLVSNPPNVRVARVPPEMAQSFLKLQRDRNELQDRLLKQEVCQIFFLRSFVCILRPTVTVCGYF